LKELKLENRNNQPPDLNEATRKGVLIVIGAAVGGLLLLLVIGFGGTYTALATYQNASDEKAKIAAAEEAEAKNVQKQLEQQAADIKASKERSAEEDAWGKKNLKYASLGMLNYESANRVFPPGRTDATLLSWRVHILPYVGQKVLYDKFHLDEPWDSPHNQSLIEFMPEVYRDKYDSPSQTKTRLQVCVGLGAAYASLDKQVKLSSIRDGLANSVSILRLPQSRAVTWTKPEDFLLDLEDAACLNVLQEILDELPAMQVATFDAGVHRLSTGITPKDFRSLLTGSGSELVKMHMAFED